MEINIIMYKSYVGNGGTKMISVFKMEFDIIISDRDIYDIIVAAFDEGINHWCDSPIEVLIRPDWSTSLERSISLHDSNEDKVYELDKEKMLKGIKMCIEDNNWDDFLVFVDRHLEIDVSYIDNKSADAIIQYALFDEIKYK